MRTLNDKLNLKEAFSAMYAFLEAEYELTGSDELGSLLGSISLLNDGSTADPAAWRQWEQAVEKVLAGKVQVELRLHNQDS